MPKCTNDLSTQVATLRMYVAGFRGDWKALTQVFNFNRNYNKNEAGKVFKFKTFFKKGTWFDSQSVEPCKFVGSVELPKVLLATPTLFSQMQVTLHHFGGRTWIQIPGWWIRPTLD